MVIESGCRGGIELNAPTTTALVYSVVRVRLGATLLLLAKVCGCAIQVNSMVFLSLLSLN